MRLAIIASHPVQYYAPLYRELATRLDLTVFYCHRDTAADQASAGFGHGFSWDVDLLSGYKFGFLKNVARRPTLGSFRGVDTPSVGAELICGRFDAVLVMGWYLKAFFQALFAAKRSGLPVLVRGDSHLVTPRSWLKRALKDIAYPIFLRQFDAALVVGERNHQYWIHYRYPLQQQFRSPHCVDTKWFAARATTAARMAVRARFAIASEAPVALFAGKLSPLKRPTDLVYGAAEARMGGIPVEILVAGAGELEGELRTAARLSGVPCHMMGFCNQTEMPSAYAAADVLVLPSSQETWGLVANEALACGRPLVLSDAVGCAPDLAGNGLAGITYPCGDTYALGKALAAVLRTRPSSHDILVRSQAHSLEAAASGIVTAVTANVSGQVGSGRGARRKAREFKQP